MQQENHFIAGFAQHHLQLGAIKRNAPEDKVFRRECFGYQCG